MRTHLASILHRTTLAATLPSATRSVTPQLRSISRLRNLSYAANHIKEASLPIMTTGIFKYIDRASYDATATEPFKKVWSKVDDGGKSFTLVDHEMKVESMRGHADPAQFNTDTTGFAVYNSPSKEKDFVDDAAIRSGYYAEVEALLKERLPGVKKVVIFDHTIRRRDKNSPRQPVQQVHVDQTPGAAEVRVRRHVEDPQEAEQLLKGRYSIINVWRPIGHAASDFPLAVIDWRSTKKDDFVPVDLLYPKRRDSALDDDDDRGKETLPDPDSFYKTDGYEVKGETYAVAPNDKHHFFFMKDMTPDEALLLKCFDSRSEWSPHGRKGIAHGTPHTAFIDPDTPTDARGRQSIEVRCLVFQE